MRPFPPASLRSDAQSSQVVGRAEKEQGVRAVLFAVGLNNCYCFIGVDKTSTQDKEKLRRATCSVHFMSIS